MSSVRRAVIAGLASLPVLLVAGCAGSDSSTAASAPSGPATPAASPAPSPAPLSAADYRLALKKLSQREDVAHHRVEGALQARTVAEVRAAFTAFAVDQRAAAGEVRALVAPADAVAANAQLATAFEHNASALDALVAKLAGASSVKRALAIVEQDQGVQRAGGELDAALTTLHKLGYASGGE